jgi:uncharacterized protein YbjT (DUF2867 family)
VPRLLARGHRVRAIARNPDKLADVPWRESLPMHRIMFRRVADEVLARAGSRPRLRTPQR